MPGNVASVFSEAEDFEAALAEEGCLGLLVTGRGAFQARLTQIGLHRLGLAAVEEQLARIAFFGTPAGIFLTVFALGPVPSLRWGGIGTERNEILTLGPGERLHSTIDGPVQWGALRITEHELLGCGRALGGARFAVPRGIARWQPPPAAAQQLRGLYRAAIRSAQRRPGTFVNAMAAHGLEQQIIDALIECVWPSTAHQEEPAATRDRVILARFEELLLTEPVLTLAEIYAQSGFSRRRLHVCCVQHLGMSPAEYRRRRALQRVHRQLRHGNVATSTVAMIARRHGFKALGRFAENYRALYGELPSATLRSSYGVLPLSLNRSPIKFL